MTMHAVLGDGEMTRRELTEALADLWKADTAEDQSFWFLLQAKAEPTDTDKALVTWLEKNEVYYEIITDDADGVDPLYSQPQETHTVQKISSGVVSLLEKKPEEDEPAEVLALFFNVNDLAAPEDKWLNGVIEAAFDAGFPTRALNDGMVEIDLSEDAAEPEPEPEEEKPVKKSVAKKAAAKPADIPVSEEGEVTEAPDDREADFETPNREELEDMEPSEVKEVAAKLGIVLPPRTRVTTYIEHILGNAKPEAPTAEVSEVPEVAIVPTTNGYSEADIAEKVVDMLWERFQKAFS